MTCFCTGRCRVPPYTCSGTAAHDPWRDIFDETTNPYTLPKVPPPMPVVDMEKENLRLQNTILETEIAKLRHENEELRKNLISLNKSF